MKPHDHTVKVTSITNSKLQNEGKIIETIATKVVSIRIEKANENQSKPGPSFAVISPITKEEKFELNCSICKYYSYDEKVYAEHVEEVHIIKCPHCDYTSKRRDRDYRSKTSERMKVHMRIHTGENNYSCTVCDFECTQKINLSKHMSVHSKIRTYACTECRFKTTTLVK